MTTIAPHDHFDDDVLCRFEPLFSLSSTKFPLVLAFVLAIVGREEGFILLKIEGEEEGFLVFTKVGCDVGASVRKRVNTVNICYREIRSKKRVFSIISYEYKRQDSRRRLWF